MCIRDRGEPALFWLFVINGFKHLRISDNPFRRLLQSGKGLIQLVCGTDHHQTSVIQKIPDSLRLGQNQPALWRLDIPVSYTHLKGLIDRLTHIVESDFAHVTYTEAVEILKKHNSQFEYQVDWGVDLQTEHEKYLTEQVFQKPVFVTDYPKEIKSFYMRMNDDGRTVAAMDMLVPGIGEIIGGSQREERLDRLTARMKELGLKEADYWWYLDLRRFGTNKHAGFGLGFERLIMYLTGIQNIRDVLPFPRTTGVAEF